MRRFSILGIIMLLLLALAPFSAWGQATGGNVGAIIFDGVKNNYGSAAAQLTPAATTTDIVTLYGSATKTIRVKNIYVSGLATTAGSMDVAVVKRTSADTAGTVVTSGSSLTITPANGTYNTFTISSQNMSSVINTGATTETATLSIAGLTAGVQYILTTTPTISSGQIPTLTATSGVASCGAIPTMVSAAVENVVFTASATTAVFTLTSTAAANYSTASTTCYATAAVAAQFDSTSPVPTATVATYSANPTAGTGAILMDKVLNFGLAGAAGTIGFDLMRANDRPIILRGTSQGIAINLNGQAVPSGGKVSYMIEWEEQ
jgi:hypothetical protein